MYLIHPPTVISCTRIRRQESELFNAKVCSKMRSTTFLMTSIRRVGRRSRRCRELVISANVQAMKKGLKELVRAYSHLADHLTQCVPFL